MAHAVSESNGIPITFKLPERFTALLPYLQRELRCDEMTVIVHGLSALVDLVERIDRGQYVAICNSDEGVGEAYMPNFLSPDYLFAKYSCCKKRELTLSFTRDLGATLHYLESTLGARNLTQVVACAIEIVAWYLTSAEQGYWVIFFDDGPPCFVYFEPAVANARAS